MPSDANKRDSRRTHRKPTQKDKVSSRSENTGEGHGSGRSAKGHRSRSRKPVQSASISSAKKRLYDSREEGSAKIVRRAGSGLGPREAIDQWLNFAQANGYRRVVGDRQFISHLDKITILEEEEKSLFEFCREKGFAFAENLKELTKGPKTQEGVEHRVFYSLADDPPRVTKVTFPGKYGRLEHTPFLYMERLALFTELFPELAIRFEDCVLSDKGEYMIISSMQAFPGPHPRPDEINAFLINLGFLPYSDGSITIDYRNPRLGVIVRDCHPKNWVKIDGEHLVPVDICPEIG